VYVSKAIRENATHWCLFNDGSSTEDIVHQYVKDHIIAMKIIKNILEKREIVVFDLIKPETDELAVRVRWDETHHWTLLVRKYLSSPLVMG
jgi:hypothetical protein